MTDNDIDRPLYSIEDDTPLYKLEDDPVPSPGDSDGEDTLYDEDDVEEDEEYANDEADDDASDEPESDVAKTPSPLAILLRTMFTPVEGWKALKRARLKTETFASRCFYPLIGVCAVSEIARMFYEANVTFGDWAKDGLCTFMTFFFGYFSVILAGGALLPSKSREVLKKDIGKQFVMLAMSTLALFWTLIQIMPMFEPVLVFLPLWTIYLVYKGVRILRVPKDVENSTTGLLCMLIIGMPVLWNWLVSEVLLPLA